MATEFKVGDIGIIKKTGEVARFLEALPNQYGHTRAVVEVWASGMIRREVLRINVDNLVHMRDIKSAIAAFKEVSPLTLKK